MTVMLVSGCRNGRIGGRCIGRQCGVCGRCEMQARQPALNDQGENEDDLQASVVTSHDCNLALDRACCKTSLTGVAHGHRSPDLDALLGCAVHRVAGFDAEGFVELRQIGKHALDPIASG